MCLLWTPPCSEGYKQYSSPLIPMCPICMNNMGIILSFILPLVIYSLFSYLLSCVIFFIINKLRKSKT